MTAVHNHLLREQPPTFYMHVAGQGDPVKLATALHDGAWRRARRLSRPRHAAGRRAAGSLDIDTAKLEQTLGHKGTANGGVYQFAHAARATRSATMECRSPPAMGTAIGVNFQPTGGGKAAITGDFVLLAARSIRSSRRCGRTASR